MPLSCIYDCRLGGRSANRNRHHLDPGGCKFYIGALIALVALVIALFLKEVPLRTAVSTAEEAGAAAR